MKRENKQRSGEGRTRETNWSGAAEATERCCSSSDITAVIVVCEPQVGL